MQLVTTTNDGQPVTTSLAIAQGTEIQHKNVMETVRRYITDLQDFGRVAFETRPFATAGGTQQREVALLNERQATLLLSYMRNSEIIRDFKKQLVREFYRMAEALRQRQASHPAIPQTYAEALQLAADQAKRIEQQDRQLEAAKPAVEFHQRVGSVPNDAHTIDETAKLLKAGPRKFRQWMRDNKILRLDGTPYQDYMRRGYFVVIEKAIDIGHAYKLHAQTYVTGKGLQYLQRKLDHNLLGQEV